MNANAKNQAPPPTPLGRFYGALFRRRRLVLVAFAAIAVAAFVSALGLRWQEDIMELLPKGDRVVERYRQLLRAFNPMNKLYVEIGAATESDRPTPEELAAVADALATRLADSPHFTKIVHRFGADEMLGAFALLQERRARLFDAEDAAALDEFAAPAAVRASLTQWKKTLTESPAPFLAQQFQRDPLGFDRLLQQKFSMVQGIGGGLQVHDGRIFSADLRHVLLMAEPKFPATDSHRAKALIDFMNGTLLELNAEARARGIRLAYMGGHRFGLDNANMIKRDLKLVISVSVACIALLSFIAYRRPLLVLLTLAPAAFGAVWATGLIYWLTPAVSAISIGCGTMLIGVAVDYGIHLLYHVDKLPAGSRGPAAVTGVLERLAPPLLLGAGTTLAAFLTLHFSILPAYRDLGDFAALGIMGAAACALLVLPLLIPAAPSGGEERARVRLAQFFPGFFRWTSRHRGWLALTLVLLSAGALAGVRRVEPDGDLQRLNGVTPETRADWKRVEATFSNVMDLTYVAVTSTTLENALRENELLYATLRKLRDAGGVKSIHSIAALLPSRRTQEENLRRWRKFWSAERVAELRAEFEKVCPELGLRAAGFAPFFAALSEEPPPLAAEDYLRSAASELLGGRIARTPDQTLVLTHVRLADPENYAAALGEIERASPNALIGNGRYFTGHMVRLMLGELRRLGTAALVAIVLLLLLLVRSPRVLAAILTPLAACLLWTFGLMGWLGVPLNIMNGVVGIFIFGLVIDYSIFLALAWRDAAGAADAHLARSGGAVSISALTTLCGLGALVLARHPALHALGLTALLGIGSGAAAVLLIVPLFPLPRARAK